MRIIAVNHVSRPDRLEGLPSEWEVWQTAKRIGVTYAVISRAAVEEEWGTDVVIIQDDVRGDLPAAEVFTVYGTQGPRHICPKAFAADAETWGQLFEAWRERPTSVCRSFTKVALERGAVILNSVTG